MPWFTRLSRFGDVHLVYSQGAVNSCGIASVMMCVFKVNKLAPGRAAITQEANIYKTYGAFDGTAYDGSSYTFTNVLEKTLNSLNCGRWKAEQIAPGAVSQRLIDVCGEVSTLGPTILSSPVIVLVGWGGGGAHFVVVDSVRNMFGSKYATVCDPADGELRIVAIEPGQDFAYENTTAISWNLEGDPAYPYKVPTSGTGGGWVIHQIS